jgi:hypothetical protein
MQLDDILSGVRDQLAATAALGDERTREIAAALATTIDPSVRLAILAALNSAADEITAALMDFPGSPAVSVGLDGDAVHVDVHATAPAEPPPSSAPRSEDTDTSARISLRLPESLKADVEAAAARENISVNSWLVRAISTALQPWPGAARFAAWADAAGRRGGGPGGAHHLSGWING